MPSRSPTFTMLTALLLQAVACTPARSEPPHGAQVPGLEPAFRLSRRQGSAPGVSDAPPGTQLAQRQLTQQAPPTLQEELFTRASALPDVEVAPSLVSVPGARAFVLRPEAARGPREAFQAGTEFAHIHPADDGSLHMKLPPALAEQVYQEGWGVPHPRSGTPLVYGPRDPAELEVVWQLLLRSHAWARGAPGAQL
ncbi:luciferase family protein [Vitiosangium sp. GDMCC 1.1324]|uniref:luciferase domain-containing protein n=1 Tax=Vitiosangium sp. (strain GDMCC 1.1324) TaxID=2138576 RepID=UPI000D3B3BC5|nr:luciferase family protein [Vitiosangium sp. GDMCC 1.1324]PTL78799.1 phospholipase [Vitiosangium sp. GDMCC 1.1324]